MKESLTIVLPIPVKVLMPNCTIATIGGRFAKAKAIKKHRQLMCEAIHTEQIETKPWERIQVNVKFYYKTKRKRDQDNAMSSLKSFYDGIVDSGLIIDDDYEHMNRGIPSFEIDQKYPRVEFTITRIV